jgi:hypothetical protein
VTDQPYSIPAHLDQARVAELIDALYYSDPVPSFVNNDLLLQVLRSMDPREVSIIVMYFALGGGKRPKLTDVNRAHGISRERAQQLKQRGLNNIRHQLDRRIALPPDETSIYELRLLAKESNALKRHGILSIETLMRYTRRELVAMEDLGEKVVSRIEERLRERGQSLAGGQDIQ